MSEGDPLHALVSRWRTGALVAGQYSVECPADEQPRAATEANVLTCCADELDAVLAGLAEDLRPRTNERELCSHCGGNGVIKIHHGVSVCPQCHGECWERNRVAEDIRPQWQPIGTCPKMRTVLLFAVSDIDEHGTVKNWKMATGSWLEGYEDERSKERGITPWQWGAYQLKVYELQPTHWMPLPAPPGVGEDRRPPQEETK